MLSATSVMPVSLKVGIPGAEITDLGYG